MKKLFLFGIILTLLATSVSAQVASDRIQRQRIERGFDKGQLTRPEKFRLEKNQFQMKNERRRAFHDGKISSRERRRLHKMRRHESREIFRMKHNGRRRAI